MYPIQTLQPEYLSYLIKTQKPVILHFKNGARLRGTVTGMTQEVIFFKYGITEFFYKKTIHSVTPITSSTVKA